MQKQSTGTHPQYAVGVWKCATCWSQVQPLWRGGGYCLCLYNTHTLCGHFTFWDANIISVTFCMAFGFTYKLYSLLGEGRELSMSLVLSSLPYEKCMHFARFSCPEFVLNSLRVKFILICTLWRVCYDWHLQAKTKNINKSITQSQFLFLVVLYKQLIWFIYYIYICHIISHSCSGSTATIACWPTTCELLGIQVALILHKIWSRLSHCMLRLDENSVALYFETNISF